VFTKGGRFGYNPCLPPGESLLGLVDEEGQVRDLLRRHGLLDDLAEGSNGAVTGLHEELDDLEEGGLGLFRNHERRLEVVHCNLQPEPTAGLLVGMPSDLGPRLCITPEDANYD